MLQTLRKKLRYEQKDHWHRMAAACFRPGSCVVDLACGTGTFMAFAGGLDLIGIDHSAGSLAKASELATVVLRGDAGSIPLRDESVDGVHCSHLIEHLTPDRVVGVLREVDRVLKPGGVFVLRAPTLWAGFYDDLTHLKPYPPDAISHYLCGRAEQWTMAPISTDYTVERLVWRYKPLRLGIPILDGFLKMPNRWGFPWLRRTGYMLVLRKPGG